MYSNVFRGCLRVTGSYYSNVIVGQARHKFADIKFTLCSRSPSSAGYVHIKHNYCTEIFNIETGPEKDRQAQKELAELFEQPEKMKLFKILELELEVRRHDAEKVPNHLRPRDWLCLMNMPSKTQRRRYLDFLWRNEKIEESQLKKRELKRICNYEKFQEKAESGPILYGLRHNSMFLRIYPKAMADFFNNKLIQAIMYDLPIVFDLGYDQHMTPLELSSCIKQLILSFASNRQHPEPFNLYFCNADKSNLLLQRLQHAIPTLSDTYFPVNVTSQSYMDVFEKNRLVYLTPHTNTIMTEYNPDHVYIIGAMVDKTSPQPISLAKAKKDGIKMARLPLEKHLQWGPGSGKNLTLNQVLNILLDLRRTKSWEKALENVPSRKLMSSRENALQNRLENLTNLNEEKDHEKKIRNESKPHLKERRSLINSKIIT